MFRISVICTAFCLIPGPIVLAGNLGAYRESGGEATAKTGSYAETTSYSAYYTDSSTGDTLANADSVAYYTEAYGAAYARDEAEAQATMAPATNTTIYVPQATVTLWHKAHSYALYPEEARTGGGTSYAYGYSSATFTIDGDDGDGTLKGLVDLIFTNTESTTGDDADAQSNIYLEAQIENFRVERTEDGYELFWGETSVTTILTVDNGSINVVIGIEDPDYTSPVPLLLYGLTYVDGVLSGATGTFTEAIPDDTSGPDYADAEALISSLVAFEVDGAGTETDWEVSVQLRDSNGDPIGSPTVYGPE